MYRSFFLSIILLFFPLMLCAQQSPTSQEMKKERAKMEQEMKRMKEETEKRRQEELAVLKKMDLEIYKERVALYERQEKINKIVSDFHQKKISEKAAKRKLFPLVKKDLKDTIENIPNRIEQLKKQVDFLQKAKRKPNLLIEKRINQILGLEVPSSEGMMVY